MNEHFCRLVGEYLVTNEVKEQRAQLAQRLIAFLGAICLLVLVFLAATYPTQAYAEEIPVHVVEHHEGVRMRLMNGPCVDPVTQQMVMMVSPPQYLPRWKGIQSQWKHKDGSWADYGGCWLMLSKEEAGAEDDVFVLFFSDGAQAQVLKRDLLQRKSGA